MRRALLAWSALVVPAWATMIYCCLNAPVVFDMWTPYFWHRETAANAAAAWHFVVENYLWNNPRLGHLATVGVALPPWNAIVMPLIAFALVYLATSCALGRLASLRRADDVLATLVLAGLLVACAPAIGPMLFYVPFTVNYVLGVMLALAFLLPYRLVPRPAPAPAPTPATVRWWYAPGLFVLAAAAGMCNEHTAPAVGLLALAAAIHARRPPAWMITGLVGFAAGAAALYLAPGQHHRYGGLANEHTAMQLVASRGVGGALHLFAGVAQDLIWIVPFAAIAAIARRRQPRTEHSGRTPIAWLAAALVIVATLLGSPKLGDRLLFAPVVLVCIAATEVIVPLLRARASRIAAGVLAAVLLIYTGVRCVQAHRVLGRESDARLAALTHAPHDSVLDLPALSIPGSRYSIGEDLDEEPHRSFISARFHLALIRLVR